MRFPSLFVSLSAACIIATSPCSSFAQEQSNGQDQPRIAVGAQASTLGIGIEAATAVTSRSNIRGSFNIFNYSQASVKDGIHYDADLELRSLQFTYDQYLKGGFHISPGLLAYNGNRLHADASAPAGQSFSLGGVRYFSSQSNPVAGAGSVELRKAAPMVLFGFGNPLSRKRGHLRLNFDAGIVFQGPPDVTLNLTGSACAINPSSGCVNAATDPIVQSNVQAEQRKIQDDLTGF